MKEHEDSLEDVRRLLREQSGVKKLVEELKTQVEDIKQVIDGGA